MTETNAEERPNEGDPEETFEAGGVNSEDVLGTKLAGSERKARDKKKNPRFSRPLERSLFGFDNWVTTLGELMCLSKIHR